MRYRFPVWILPYKTLRYATYPSFHDNNKDILELKQSGSQLYRIFLLGLVKVLFYPCLIKAG